MIVEQWRENYESKVWAGGFHNVGDVFVANREVNEKKFIFNTRA